MVLRLLQIILIIVAVRAVWRLFQGMLEGAGYVRLDGPGQGGKRDVSSVKLARDPVCGMFVSPASALAVRADGKTFYFCSDKCRRDWERSARS
jgi:YHS domain-containing protein